MAVSNMKRNVSLLALCQGYAQTSVTVVISVSALAALLILEDRTLATLPHAFMWCATAMAATPASLLMKRYGRRRGFAFGALFGVAGCALCTLGLRYGDFWIFVAGTSCFGAFNAFNQYLRFAAAETADAEFRPKAISLVIGGGAIGLAAALALAAQGCGEVVVAEPNAARRDHLARRCGVVAVPEARGDWPLVIDAVGFAATRAAASARTAPGGVIVHIGLGEDAGGLDIRRMTLQEITFIGTYTYTDRDFRDTCAAMFAGRLGPLDWAEARDLSEGAAAFADIRAGRVASPKIVLRPGT